MTVVVPLPVFPPTLHSSHKEKRCISFLEPHRFILKTGEDTRVDQRLTADYLFLSADHYKLFQEHLCDKDLIGTFDFRIIRSEGSTRKLGEATARDLKIWRDLSRPCHSISFF